MPSLPPLLTEQERILIGQRCTESFFEFVQYGFGVRYNPRGRWLTRRFHKPICDLVQREAANWFERRRRGEQGRTKVMLVIPRGMGKTVTITKCFPMWCQLHDPDLSCVISSESTEKSQDFLSSIKTVMEGGDPYARFTWLYGRWRDANRIWRDAKFTHALRKQMSLTEPSFNSTSVEKGATGFHPDMLVVDDLISQERIREQGNWIQLAVNHVHALIPALRTDSFQLVVGTPYANNDVIYTLLEEDGIKEAHGMKLPPLMPQPSPEGQWILYFVQARDSTGHSVLPEAWSDEELDDYERKRPMDFAAQMMCTPGAGEHMPLTQSQVDELWVKRDNVPHNINHVFLCDTAFKTMKRMAAGDESVLEHWGIAPSGDVYYLEGYGGNDWRIEDFSRKLVQLCQQVKSRAGRVRAIVDERPVGGKEGAWEAYLRNVFADANLYMPPLIMLTRQHTRKIERITEAAGYWVDGRVHLVRNAPGVHKLIRQMLQIGVAAHDDWADAGADVFNPQIYRPAMADAEDVEAPIPRRPYDRYLQTGVLDDEAAIYAYDMGEEKEVDPWFTPHASLDVG